MHASLEALTTVEETPGNEHESPCNQNKDQVIGREKKLYDDCGKERLWRHGILCPAL